MNTRNVEGGYMQIRINSINSSVVYKHCNVLTCPGRWLYCTAHCTVPSPSRPFRPTLLMHKKNAQYFLFHLGNMLKISVFQRRQMTWAS